ncbi:hypothetical protein BJY16_005046 [Actinoplanes octamycinicus]|uniref:Uncharacterized protein n=1 Tax=Actinoplanes octamycinicus TaxID=135948 RepID=A0A7W7M960_9ACTN|nr:hypothetical protein [Actinoplanes octamycinicus]
MSRPLLVIDPLRKVMILAIDSGDNAMVLNRAGRFGAPAAPAG